MLRIGCVVAIVVGLVGLPCAAAPRADAPELEFRFGLAVEGDVVTHTFLLRNAGDSPLSVLDIVTECGCTTGDISVSPIEPGASAELSVTLRTQGYGDETLLRSVFVATDDPARPVLEFRLSGRVVRRDAVLLDPAGLAGRILLVVDLRDPAAYAAGHLLGAVSLSASPDEVAAWLSELPNEVSVLVYDQDGVASAQLALRLVAAGWAGIRSLAGGLDEWVRQFGDSAVTTTLPLVVTLPARP